MMEVRNGNIHITINKLYIIPLHSIESYIMNNDEFLQNASMQDLKDVFVYGIPNNIKDYLLKKVSLYDSSSSVNSFICEGQEYWLDKSQRNSLYNLFSSADPEEEFEIVFENLTIKKKAGILVAFLRALEKYAYQCFVVTQKHLNTIKALQEPTNSEENEVYINTLLNYDFTSGYPEKLTI